MQGWHCHGDASERTRDSRLCSISLNILGLRHKAGGSPDRSGLLFSKQLQFYLPAYKWTSLYSGSSTPLRLDRVFGPRLST